MAQKSTSVRAKMTALNKALRSMFGRLQARPVPDRLMSVVDQLDVAEDARPPKTSERR